MSVLKTTEAVPCRVAAVFRFLLTCDGAHVERQRLEAALSPEALRSEKGEGKLIRVTVSECMKMGLLSEEKGGIAASPEAAAWSHRRPFSATRFRELVLDRITDRDNPENHDLCRALAWFLAQDVTTSRSVKEDVAEEGLEITNATGYEAFSYWSVYLGFAWRHAVSERQLLVPDPTRYLESSLPALFAEGECADVPIGTLMARLAERCPIFEGGYFYERIVETIPARLPEHLPSALALAWLRLRDRGLVELETRSDAPGLVVPDGITTRRYTHARRMPVRQGER